MLLTAGDLQRPGRTTTQTLPCLVMRPATAWLHAGVANPDKRTSQPQATVTAAKAQTQPTT